jgi:hypothetical protein
MRKKETKGGKEETENPRKQERNLYCHFRALGFNPGQPEDRVVLK